MSAVGLASMTTVMVVLALVAFGPDARRRCSRVLQRRKTMRVERARSLQRVQDPGEVLRAERRAERRLLETLGPQEFEAYRALGFLHVYGSDGRTGYLLYPRTSIVSFDAVAGEPLDEFTYASGARDSSSASDASDLLAKWEALVADEGSVASSSNMHLLGRDVDPVRVRRDLIRLSEWTSRRPAEHSESAAKPLRHPNNPDRGQTNP